ncbi:MAG TPA: ABC transporter permease [Candidatus Limnocylindria bacterium]|nr:ABC transporter permease [Candidatus Limnocylindria bacterium]
MSLRRTFAITARLLAQFRHDPRTLAILFVTPLVLLTLFALLFRADVPDPRVGVLLEGSDAFATSLAEALDDSDAISAMRLSEDDDADALIRDGTIDAYIVVPNIATGPSTIEVVVEGTDPRVSAIVPAALQTAVLEGLSRALATLPTQLMQPELHVDVRSLYGGDEELDTLDLIGGPFIGLLVFFLVYVVTSVSFLRERSLGTLERLMASPLRRAEIVLGYALGFMVVALVQSAEVLLFGLLVLDLYNAGSIWLLFGIEVLLALGAVNLGILLSTFARTEFEAVQFIPLVIVPQLLLSGLLVPVSSEPEWLQVVSNVLPLTYAVDALQEVMLRGADLSSATVQRDIAVLAGFCVLVIGAASLTLRREVA